MKGRNMSKERDRYYPRWNPCCRLILPMWYIKSSMDSQNMDGKINIYHLLVFLIMIMGSITLLISIPLAFSIPHSLIISLLILCLFIYVLVQSLICLQGTYWLGKNRFVFHSFKTHRVEIREIHEVFLNRIDNQHRNDSVISFELVLIKHPDFRRVALQGSIFTSRWESFNQILAEYFQRLLIPFNQQSAYYYYERLKNKKLTDEEIEDASKQIDELLLKPDAGDKYFKIKGLWLSELGEDGEAIQWLQQFLAHHPDDMDATSSLVSSLVRRGYGDEALTITMELLNRFPENFEIIELHARTLNKARKPEEGIAFIDHEIMKLIRTLGPNEGFFTDVNTRENISKLLLIKYDILKEAGLTLEAEQASQELKNILMGKPIGDQDEGIDWNTVDEMRE